MFCLEYYKYILGVIKNTLCPDIDNTLYNTHTEYLISRKAIKRISAYDNIENDLTISFFISYDYLNIYVNDYIKYFCLDTSLYMRLNRYYRVVGF